MEEELWSILWEMWRVLEIEVETCYFDHCGCGDGCGVAVRQYYHQYHHLEARWSVVLVVELVVES